MTLVANGWGGVTHSSIVDSERKPESVRMGRRRNDEPKPGLSGPERGELEGEP